MNACDYIWHDSTNLSRISSTLKKCMDREEGLLAKYNVWTVHMFKFLVTGWPQSVQGSICLHTLAMPMVDYCLFQHKPCFYVMQYWNNSFALLELQQTIIFYENVAHHEQEVCMH